MNLATLKLQFDGECVGAVGSDMPDHAFISCSTRPNSDAKQLGKLLASSPDLLRSLVAVRDGLIELREGLALHQSDPQLAQLSSLIRAASKAVADAST